jgi:Domain of unknown function (DUF4337)
MPEEGLETQEIKEQLDESNEKAEGEGGEKGEKKEGSPRWITLLSLSTAFIAALAAVASLHAGGLANEALLLKSQAILVESQVADTWGEYEARSIKAYLFDTQAVLLPPDKGADAAKHADKERGEAAKLKAHADELKKEVDAKNEESSFAMERHETYARSVTIFQIAIAVAAIAALTRKKWMWLLSLVGGAAGIALFSWGFVIAPHGETKGEGKGEPAAASAPAPGEAK